ncbi:MAG TPA: outer membrane beta-barrel protein [Xanthobacteraceae bacterium]|jgi:outer membrane immunogenic protein
MKRFVLAAAAAAASFAVPAQAADLARPAPPIYAPPPPIVAVFTWTGCYVGANGGGLWSNWDLTDNFGFFGPIGTSLGSNTASGGLGGLQGGCNYQTGNWVFGIQGDYDWASATSDNATGTAFLGLAPLGISAVSESTKVDSLASVTGRIGYAWGRFLGYVKGGGAWVKNDYTLTATFVPPAPFIGTAPLGTLSNTRGGWTIGVGGEYAFLDWLTGFAEYDYYGFSSQSANFNCVGGVTVCVFPAGVPLAAIPVDVTQHINVVKVGLNVKFGGW